MIPDQDISRRADFPESTAERYRTLLEINNAIVTNLKQEDLLRSIQSALLKVISFDSVGLTLFDPAIQAFRFLALEGSGSGHFFVGRILERTKGIPDGPFDPSHPLLLPDLSAEPGTDFTRELLAEGFLSFCGVPLMVWGELRGSLGVASKKRHLYGPEDAAFLQEVANQVALSVANMQAYEALQEEAGRRTQAEESLREIMEGTAAVTGDAFFLEMVRHLASALRVKYALVTECIGEERERARTLGFWSGAGYAQNYEYDVASTPCKLVYEGDIHLYAREVQKQFPQDRDLARLRAESYLGVPVFGSTGHVVGHLVVLDDRPMSEEPRGLSILKIFAARAGAEIERMRTESDLRRALEEVERLKNRLQAENLYLQEEIRQEHNFEEIVGNSPPLLKVLQRVERVAPIDSTVMIYGETGTGKELVARAIHSRSRRCHRPLVKVNCGALSAGLVESELFGHVKGAYTGALERRVGRFELADGGTLFLDEVGELPLETQVKLLRVLQEGEFEPVGSSHTVTVDVRIIAATNRNLEEMVQAGRFRSDLFFRLNVLPISIPALRERASDIPQLVMFFLSRFSRQFGKAIHKVSQETMERLVGYSWPGNIRELQNLIERSVVLSPGNRLEVDQALLDRSIPHPEMGPAASAAHPQAAPARAASPRASSATTLEAVERDHILAVLAQTGWVIEGPKGAALILSLHPNTLRSRMKKLGIRRPTS